MDKLRENLEWMADHIEEVRKTLIRNHGFGDRLILDVTLCFLVLAKGKGWVCGFSYLEDYDGVLFIEETEGWDSDVEKSVQAAVDATKRFLKQE